MIFKKHIKSLLLLASALLILVMGNAQPLTGIWQGKINRQTGLFPKYDNLELKLIRNGDSLSGSVYYYSSKDAFSRFRIKGYVNPYDGTVTWWDDSFIESKNQGNNKQSVSTLHFVTDFNCPGEGIMKLDGEAEKDNEKSQKKIPVHLVKVDEPIFADEWDYVLENFSTVGNEPALIDSIEKSLTIKNPEPIKPVTKPALTIEEMFVSRKKVLVTEIPVSGDSIELRFYDHAEIDGDSISLFFNNRLLQKNILLKATPFIIKLPVTEMHETNELIMVAENLGSIPPNTSLMIAYINDIRYEARLESTENASAMIRFFKTTQAAKKMDTKKD
ncbi:MAG: hypothetical protein ACRC2O_15600 [Chitinophagaceae bacterium]